MWLAGLFGIDQDIIQIYHNEDIKLLSENFVNIALKINWYVKKSNRYDLILEVTISSTKNHLPLIAFLNSHLIIDTSEI